MYLLTHVARYFVGVLFIFSGLIKLNDPVGTQIKLEEYFDVFATDIPALSGLFHGLVPLALYLSVILCVLEVVLGIALLIKYKLQSTLWVLLLLTVFFTFLTFYSAYFNRVTDCGCFGDAIKLTPWQSFSKDIIPKLTGDALAVAYSSVSALDSATVACVRYHIFIMCCPSMIQTLDVDRLVTVQTA